MFAFNRECAYEAPGMTGMEMKLHKKHQAAGRMQEICQLQQMRLHGAHRVVLFCL